MKPLSFHLVLAGALALSTSPAICTADVGSATSPRTPQEMRSALNDPETPTSVKIEILRIAKKRSIRRENSEWAEVIRDSFTHPSLEVDVAAAEIYIETTDDILVPLETAREFPRFYSFLLHIERDELLRASRGNETRFYDGIFLALKHSKDVEVRSLAIQLLTKWPQRPGEVDRYVEDLFDRLESENPDLQAAIVNGIIGMNPDESQVKKICDYAIKRGNKPARDGFAKLILQKNSFALKVSSKLPSDITRKVENRRREEGYKWTETEIRERMPSPFTKEFGEEILESNNPVAVTTVCEVLARRETPSLVVLDFIFKIRRDAKKYCERIRIQAGRVISSANAQRLLDEVPKNAGPEEKTAIALRLLAMAQELKRDREASIKKFIQPLIRRAFVEDSRFPLEFLAGVTENFVRTAFLSSVEEMDLEREMQARRLLKKTSCAKLLKNNGHA